MQKEIVRGFRLSPQQRHLWSLRREAGRGPFFVQCVAAVEGALEEGALREALRQTVARHEILRTSFADAGDGAPLQSGEGPSDLPLEAVDLRGLDATGQGEEVRALLEAAAAEAAGEGTHTSLRATLVALGAGRHALLLTLPAMCADAPTLRLLVEEIARAYAAGPAGPAGVDDDEEPVQYADVAEWQNVLFESEDTEIGRAYWRRQESLSRPAPALPFEGGAAGPFVPASHSLEAGPEVVAAVEAAASVCGTTAAVFLHACWHALLWRLTGRSELFVGHASDGRDYPELERTLGPLAKHLPVAAEAEPGLGFGDFVARVAASLREAHKWQESFAWEQVGAGAEYEPFAAYSFDYSPAPEALSAGGVTFRVERQEGHADRFRLHLSSARESGSLRLRFHYDAGLYAAADVERLAGFYLTLLRAAAARPSERVERLELLAGEERVRVIEGFNPSRRRHTTPATLHGLFERQAALTPDAPALSFDGLHLSYSELNARANRLARRLRSLGVGPESPVALYLDRSAEMVVAILAVLKAGGAYLPLDPDYPAERVLFAIEDAGAQLLLTQETMGRRLGAGPLVSDGRLINLGPDWSQFDGESAENLPEFASPDNLAYVIYTSGSTGKPKGVQVTHANVCRLFASAEPLFSFSGSDVWTLFHSYAFDFSVWELWGALLYGGRLVVVPQMVARSAESFLALLEAEGVTVLNQTPSAFYQLARADEEEGAARALALRYVVFGGEALGERRLGPWVGQRGVERPRLVNMYGITETTVHVTHREVTADLGEGSRIGAALDDLRAYVLEGGGSPAPVGVAGELYVAGDGLARGYLNRPSLTAERFVPDPFSAEPGARMYRSGDVARWLSSGELEYLGRADQQVKVRGFRIELGEIEAALLGHAGVREAVVVVREDASGDKRLVAYYAGDDASAPSGPELRERLRERLPEYMVPAQFVRLARMPLTNNGKLDRKALPEPAQGEDSGARAYVAPRTPAEEILAGVWSRVLGVERVSAHDSFFDLGGHSLIVTQLASRVREAFGVELSLRDVFEAPTLAELARAVEEAMRARREMPAEAILPADRTGELPLSFAQQRLWFIDQLEQKNPFYNIPTALRLTGRLDAAALGRTLDEIVRRHEVLRTSFAASGGRPVQVVNEARPLPLPIEDLSGLPAAEREEAARRAASEEAQRPFDLRESPLLRARLLRLGADEHVFLLTMHHIVSDGWSMGVLVNEVAALYQAYSAGLPSPLEELEVQYADFAAWQRGWLQGEVLEKQLSYWREQLGGPLPVLELPTDRPRPAVYSHRGGQFRFEVPKEVAVALRELSRAEGATLFMTLLAAFQTLLSRYSGQEEIVVGTDIANRNRRETEDLIGFFVNQLVLRTDLSGDPTFRELLARVREVSLGAYVHQDVPFERLVEELQPERDLSRNPLFQVKFILQNAPAAALEIPGLSLAQMGGGGYTTRFDLTFSMVDGEDGLLGGVEYSAELFDEATVARMVEHFKVLLAGVAADPDGRLRRLPLLPAEESRRLLVEWNDTASPYRRDLLIHQLFEEQAARAPEAVAVAAGGEEVTYAELNGRANRLARHLRDLGVGPEALVGICMERSVEMMVALLGVLKAGGAYVPLDPAYPLDRLSYMLEDARAGVLLTQERLLDNLPAHWAHVVAVDSDWGLIEGESAENPEPAGLPENLAYVIYTSGSTGRPKGVQLSHRGLLNLARAQALAFGPAAGDRVLQFASLSFDASIFEVVMALASGAALVLAGRDELMPGAPLAGLLAERGVTNATLPPSALAQLPAAALPELRTIIVAGEACGPELVERWAPGRRFFNAYGPSEATVWSSVAECRPGARRPPIGRPVANVRLYVLDREMRPAPVGVAGELYIGGDGLARCYLGRPALTAERFVPDPFAAEPGGRLYRAGDLARHLAGGELDFLGRIDQQVKLRGFRIEPGEIEAALSRHPSIQDCCVVVREDVPGDRRLVAYVAVAEADAAPASGELRAHLKESLPEHMIPSAFVVMEALPVSLNGKVDRKALPAPDQSRPELEGQFVAPRTPAEEVLAAVFAEVLGLERVGAEDNFFELGGHSLLATQLISRVRDAFGVEPSLRSVFEAPTVGSLARLVEEAVQAERGVAAPPITPAPRGGDLPLSFAQQRLWFIDQLEPGSPVYNLPSAVRLTGRLDVAALEQTVGEIVRRHEILRTTFETKGREPVQVVHPFEGFALPVVDLSRLDEEAREAEARRLAATETQTPFDLGRGPLMRASLLRLGEGEHVLLVTMHHVISDGWSVGVLVREVAALYRAFREGRPSPLEELPLQYADFAAWQRGWLRGEALERHLAYWRQKLRAAPALELPTARPRPQAQHFRGARQSFVLPAELSAELKALSKREQATLFMTLYAAFAAQLHRYTGQEDIVLGTDVANRNRGEIEPLIGFFVNQLVLRADLSGDPTFRELLARSRETTLEAYAHQDVPFDKLVEALRPDRAVSRTPLFQAKVVLLNAPLQHLELPGLALSPFEVSDESGTAKFDLVVTMMDGEEGLLGYMEYNTDLFDHSDVERLVRHYSTLLASAAREPDARLSALGMLTEGELREREEGKRRREESNARKFKSSKPRSVSLPKESA